METCKRCLLREMDRQYYESIYQYIDSLPEEILAPEAERERRMKICLSCSDFMNGMCRLCGCFAEVRSAKRSMGCPRPNPLW